MRNRIHFVFFIIAPEILVELYEMRLPRIPLSQSTILSEFIVRFDASTICFMIEKQQFLNIFPNVKRFIGSLFYTISVAWVNRSNIYEMPNPVVVGKMFKNYL